MGKGNRNRQNREVEERIEIVKVAPAKKKKARVRKPLSPKAKSIITYAITIVLLLGALAGILAGMGTFKRANVIVDSKSGDYDLNQQMATYVVWSSAYYEYYYSWQYSMSTEDKATFNNALNGGQELTADQYAQFASANLVQRSLKSAFESFESTFRGYVAVCDAAEDLGITLTKDELKTAAKEAKEQMEYMASSAGYSLKRYLKTAIGCNVKMRDIKKVAKYQALYTKVMESEQARVEGLVTDEIKKNYRDQNLDLFYSTDYISYVIKEGEEDLKTALLAATSAKEFKSILAAKTFEDNFETVFNKYTVYSNATALEAALKGKTTAEEFNQAITDAKAGDAPKLESTDAVATVTKNQEGLAAKVNDWIFSSDRKAFDVTLITDGDGKAYYVIALEAKPENDTASALIKKYDMKDGKTHGEDNAFDENLLNTILVELELLDKEEGKVYYDDVDATTDAGKMKADLLQTIETALPAEKTQAYVAEPEALSYQDWMFDKDSVEAPADAVAGKVKEFSKTEGEGESAKTTVTVYCIVEAMKYETDPLIDGGYVTYDKDTHAADAQSFLESLAGLTGDALKEKFTADAASTVSEVISESSLDKDLAAWLFSTDRKANDTGKIVGEKKSYVAFYNGSIPTWEYRAETGYVNETLSTWLEDLSADYKLDGMKWIKDKTTPTTTEA